MEIKIVEKADLNSTVESLMKERPRIGADYLDLNTGNLVNIIVDAPAPSESKKRGRPKK